MGQSGSMVVHMPPLNVLSRYLLLDRNLLAFFVVAFLYGFGISMSRPVLAPFLSFVGASPFIIGLLFAIGLSVRTLVCLPAGLISDRFGRKKIMLLTTLCGVLGSGILATSGDWLQALFGIVFFEVSEYLWMTIQTPFALDYVGPEKRGLVSGILTILHIPQRCGGTYTRRRTCNDMLQRLILRKPLLLVVEHSLPIVDGCRTVKEF
jgi:hypothetical protein